jgi:hypothetical protein
MKHAMRYLFGITLLGVLLACTPVYGATIGLYDWAFNLNGTVYSWTGSGDLPYTAPHAGYLPGSFNTSSFDFPTGLGTIAIDYNPGAGSYFFVVFMDHEIDNSINGPYNEFVYDPALNGTLGLLVPGQKWEADEPGWVFGDIYTNATGSGNNLDNLDAVPPAFPDNASMALGWNFTIPSGKMAVINIVGSETAPGSGFYLRQQDADTGNVYLSGSIEFQDLGPQAVPEPTTWVMLGSGLLAMGVVARRRIGRP